MVIHAQHALQLLSLTRSSEIGEVEKLIAAEALGCPEGKRLMTVPGANVIVAATFIPAVD